MPDCRIVAVSLDDIDTAGFIRHARSALDESLTRKVTETDWATFADHLEYVPIAAGAGALRDAVLRAEKQIAGECRRLHYLSVPPAAALSAVRMPRCRGRLRIPHRHGRSLSARIWRAQ